MAQIKKELKAYEQMVGQKLPITRYIASFFP